MKVVQFTIPVTGEHSVIVQEDRLPHFYVHLHRHTETQITWIIEGEGTLITGDYMQAFKPGDVYIIGANQPHLFKSDPDYFDKRKKKRVHSLTVFFNAETFLQKFNDLPELKSVNRFIRTCEKGLQVPPMQTSSIIASLEQIKQQKNALRLASFLELLDKLTAVRKWKILSSVSSAYPISDTEGLRMNDIYQYTMSHFTETIPLSAIAAVAHLTPQAFCRYFKKHTRKTYILFVNEIRIHEACKRMLEPDFDSIASIAYKSGFNNVVTFNRVFRKIIGKSPGEYLREYQLRLVENA